MFCVVCIGYGVSEDKEKENGVKKSYEWGGVSGGIMCVGILGRYRGDWDGYGDSVFVFWL